MLYQLSYTRKKNTKEPWSDGFSPVPPSEGLEFRELGVSLLEGEAFVVADGFEPP
jgi:hypothetical protein